MDPRAVSKALNLLRVSVEDSTNSVTIYNLVHAVAEPFQQTPAAIVS